MADETIQIDVVADFTKIRNEIERLTGQTVNLKTKADTSGAAKELDDVAKDRTATVKAKADASSAASELDKAAKDRSATVKATAETASAEKELARLAKDRTSNVKAKADTSGAGVELDRLAKDRTATVKATAETSAASAALAKLTKAQGVNLRPTVDTSAVGGIKAKLTGLLDSGGLSKAAGSLDDLLGKIPGLGSLTSGLTGAAGAAEGAASGMSSLASSAAAAGPAVALVAAALVTVAGSLASISAARNYARQIQTITQATGLAAEEASKLVAVTEQLGASLGQDISVGDLADVLLNITTNAEKLRTLGADIGPNDSALESLQAVADAYVAAGTAAEKAQIATAALGEEGARQFSGLLAEGAEGIAAALEAIPEGKVFSEEDLQTAKELDQAVAKIKAQFQGLLLTVGKAFLPAVRDGAEAFADFAPVLGVIAKILGFIVQQVARFTSMIIDAGLGLPRILGLIDDPAEKTKESTGGIADSLEEALNAASGLGSGLGEVVDVAKEVQDAIAAAFDPVANFAAAEASITSALDKIRQQASDPLTLDIDAKQSGIDLAKGISDQLQAEVDLGLISPENQIAELQSRLGGAAAILKLTPEVDTEALRSQIEDALSVAFDPQISLTDAQIDVADAVAEIQQQIEDSAGGEGVTIPTTLDARKSADELAKALSAEVQANVDLGLVAPEDQIAALRTKLQDAIGVLKLNPEVNADRITELETILGRLKAPVITPTVNDQTIGQIEAIRARLEQPVVIKTAFDVAQTERVPLALAEKSDQVLKVSADTSAASLAITELKNAATSLLLPVTADTTAAKAAVAGVAAKPVTVPVTADTTAAKTSIDSVKSKDVAITTSAPGLDVVLEKYNRLRNKAVAVTFTAPGLSPIVGQYERLRSKAVTINFQSTGIARIQEELARIRDKTITITVNQVGTIPGNWRGGPLGAGQMSWVSERGQEMFVGASGKRWMLPPSESLFVAPEAGRVLTAAQTRAMVRHEHVAHHETTSTTSAPITVISPHPRLAGQDVKRVLESGGRRR